MSGHILGLNGISDDILKSAESVSGISVNEASQSNTSRSQLDGAIDGVGGKVLGAKGTESIFNPFTIFRYSEYGAGANGSTQGTYDVGRHRNIYQSSNILGQVKAGKELLEHKAKNIVQNPSAVNIVDWANVQALKGADHFGPLYPYPYQINDFLWCKWYGKIPNNRLLTLRRYPIPVEDNLGIHKEKAPLVPIAQAVSWWGGETGNKLSELLGMSYGFKWSPRETTVEDVQGNELRAEALIDTLGVTNPTARQALLALIGSSSEQNPFAFSGYDATLQQFTKDSWERGAYWNRVLGPINVIDSTLIRERGFENQEDIKLDFEYNLRSYGLINPKIAMLDILTNFLSLTYQRASFWGGGQRYFQNTGVLLPGISTDAMEKGDYITALKELASTLGNGLTSGGEALASFVDGLGKKLEGKTTAEMGSIITNELSGSTVVKNVLASRMAELHQKPLLMRSFLDGRAVGEWHLMVGNPMDPIAVIGNLCMDKTTMTLSDELGADDFPVSIKFSVTLKHGRPRAKQDIESMFNHGGGDLGFTALASPSSSMNSYGEYNNARLANAYGTSVGVSTDNETAKFKADLLATSHATTKDIALTVKDPATGAVNSQAAEYSAQYFRTSVANKYGAGFGKSPILVDYFTELKTKD